MISKYVQLSDALKASGFEIDRKSLSIKNEPIKELGIYEAETNLYKEVKQLFKFEVVSDNSNPFKFKSPINRAFFVLNI